MTVQQGLVDLPGTNPTAGVGHVGALAFAGSQITYGIVNAPPGPPVTEPTWPASHDRFITAYSNPDKAAFGVGGYEWVGREVFALSAAPNWSLDFTVTLQRNSHAAYAGHSGLVFVRSLGGRRLIAGMAPAASSAARVVVVWLDLDNRTVGWQQAEFGVTAPSGTPENFSQAFAHHGRLWGVNEGDVFAWDPDANRVQSYTAGTVGHIYARLIEVRNRMFWLGKIGTDLIIKEWMGGFFLQQATLGTYSPTDGHFGLFALNGDLYTFHYADNGGAGVGIRHFVTAIPSSTPGSSVSTPVEFTVPVIPAVGTQGTPLTPWPNTVADWRYRVGGPAIPGSRIKCMALNETPLGGNLSSVLVYFSFSTAPRNHDIFSYAGTAAPMVQITPIGPPPSYRPSPNVEIVDESFPACYTGSLTWNIGESPHVVIREVVQETIGGDPNRIRISFFVTANGTTTGLSVAFYWIDMTQGATGGPHPFAKCSLIPGTVTGVDQFSTPAVLDAVDDQVQQVTGEPGSPNPTVYTVGWDTTADGKPMSSWGKLLAVFEGP